MKTNLKDGEETREGLRPPGAEQRLKERGTKLRLRLSRSAPMWKQCRRAIYFF